MSDSVAQKPKSQIGAVIRVASGNFLEMYDFMVYAYYASYIAREIFPSSSEFASLMLTLGTFGAGYLMRPLGAVILGAYIDRCGRRKGLILTLLLMAVGTAVIAFTPAYRTIGLAAPLLQLAPAAGGEDFAYRRGDARPDAGQRVQAADASFLEDVAHVASQLCHRIGGLAVCRRTVHVAVLCIEQHRHFAQPLCNSRVVAGRDLRRMGGVDGGVGGGRWLRFWRHHKRSVIHRSSLSRFMP